MKLNLLVIKTNKLEQLKMQYESLGLIFDYHRHGSGLFHYSSEVLRLLATWMGGK